MIRKTAVSRRRIEKNAKAFIALQNIINPCFSFNEQDYRGATETISGTCNECGTKLILAPQFGWSRKQICPYCTGLVKTIGQYGNEQIVNFKKLIKKRQAYSKQLQIVGKFQIEANEYFNSNSKVAGKCIACGTTFKKSMKSWLAGFQCPTCKANSYIRKLQEKLPFFDFSEFIYRGFEKKSKITCKECGKVFYKSCNELLYCDWKRCYHNLGRKSFGEAILCEFLDSLGIDYETQKTFDDLRSVNGRLLRYDFYLPDYNLLIEYNGDQHYRPVKFSSLCSENELMKSFTEAKQRDKIKERYAFKNDFLFLVINETYEHFSIEDFKKTFGEAFDKTEH